MSLSFTDASGNSWFIDNLGNLSTATRAGTFQDALDGSSIGLYLNGSTSQRFPSWGASTASGNTHTVTATDSAAGISLTRKAFVGDGFVRVLEVVTNTGTTTTNVRLSLGDNIYYDSNTVVSATSSGDTTRTTEDDWAAYGSGTNTSAPRLVHVMSGGAGSPTSVSQASADSPETSFTFDLAVGQTKVVMHFYALAADAAGATTVGNAIAGLGSADYLSGLSTAELQALVNFTQDVTASTTTTLQAHQLNLTLTGTGAINGTGNDRDNQITGNSGANKLNGLAGNDTLDGGAGADTLTGGTGDDVLVVDSTGDVVTESANQGIDTVRSSITFSLAARPYIENVELTGSAAINATGNATANLLVGNAGANRLSAGDGNDTLEGRGGIDTLEGGLGNDLYRIDSASDVITDTGGSDTVESAVTFSLAAVTGIEHLILAGTAAIAGTGNSGANRITGNDAANRIDGGTGNDTMAGGAGNDTYVVREAGDVVQEALDAGTDKVEALVTHTLASNVESLQLMGTVAISGTGNGLDNLITGNAAGNVLNGGLGNDTLNGGGGVDSLRGGDGDDTYVVDTSTDSIVDTSGIDTIQTSVTLSLAGYGSIENLVLTGSAAINGTGNGLDNVITGNSAANVIDGGSGIDTASYATAAAAVTVSLAVTGAQATGAGNDTLLRIENLTGGNFGDRLTGDGGSNVLDGGAGNDILRGGGGDDALIGNKGNDQLIDGVGHDTLNGGGGDDVYVVTGSGGSAEIFDSAGTDTLDASAATAGVSIDLTPGASSNIDGRIVTLSAGGEVDAPLDVLFLQDCSGSFGDDVAKVGTLVPQVVSTLGSFQTDLRFGLASFIDKGEYVYRTDLAMTTDQQALVTALADLDIGSGGDTPEAQIEALMQAALRGAEIGFRGNSLRVAVVMTDAPFHVAGESSFPPNDGDALAEDEDYPTLSLLKSKLAASGVVPVFAVTADNESTYQDLVDYLGFGTVVTLATDSSNLISVLTQGITQITEARIENAVGSAFNDVLVGNGLANRLEGGAGNDTYYVQGGEDTIVEASAGGTDLVSSTGSYALGANVEHLTLLGSDGIDATGNGLANILTGNAGDNRLDGGAGADRMLGGRGNDTYVVDNAGDRVIEYVNNGLDTVETALDAYKLGGEIENLRLLGTAAIGGSGNVLANVLTGNSAGNALSGLGGNDTLIGGGGVDTLTGGAGADAFRFDVLATDAGDRIADFVSGTDRILIGKETFGGFYAQYAFDNTTGLLDPGSFISLPNGTTSYTKPYDVVFIYRQDTGKLYVDLDGAYSSFAEVELATLTGAPALASTDFFGV